MKKEVLSFLRPFPTPTPTPLPFLFIAQVLIQASLGERQVCCLHQLAMVGKLPVTVVESQFFRAPAKYLFQHGAW